jgi:hypothetical protein
VFNRSVTQPDEDCGMATPTKILERVKVRELAGVFHSRDAMDAAVSALLSSGFDRADIDVMVGTEARERLGGIKITVEELPEVPAPGSPSLLARTLSSSGRSLSPWWFSPAPSLPPGS